MKETVESFNQSIGQDIENAALSIEVLEKRSITASMGDLLAHNKTTYMKDIY